MNDFVKRMIVEHKELCEKIDKLNEVVYNEENPIHKATSKVDYANMAIQLNAMKTYANALECRINNQGVYIDEDGKYMQEVDLSDNEVVGVVTKGDIRRAKRVVDTFVADITSPVEKKGEAASKAEERQHNDDINMK